MFLAQLVVERANTRAPVGGHGSSHVEGLGEAAVKPVSVGGLDPLNR